MKADNMIYKDDIEKDTSKTILLCIGTIVFGTI